MVFCPEDANQKVFLLQICGSDLHLYCLVLFHQDLVVHRSCYEIGGEEHYVLSLGT